MNEFRVLAVRAGDNQIADGQRVRVQGSKNMTLFPDLFAVEIYNMSDEDIAAISESGRISVFGETGGLLCSGEVDDIYSKQSGPNVITYISVSDGGRFWRSGVSVTLGGGSSVKSAIRSIVTGVSLGQMTTDDVPLSRGQTYTGRLPECISFLAKTLRGRAYVTNGTLFITAKGKSAEVVVLNEDDIILDQETATGARFIKTKIKGFPVGAIVEIGDARYRLVSQKFNADNYSGSWDSYLILIKDENFEMEGG